MVPLLWRTVVVAVWEERDGVPAADVELPEVRVVVPVDVRAVLSEVVRTVVRPLLVTLELETCVSLRSTLARPDWDEPVVVVLAPDEAARTVVEDRLVVPREEEVELRVVWASSGAIAASRSAAVAVILRKVFICKQFFVVNATKNRCKIRIFPENPTFSFYICML